MQTPLWAASIQWATLIDNQAINIYPSPEAIYAEERQIKAAQKLFKSSSNISTEGFRGNFDFEKNKSSYASVYDRHTTTPDFPNKPTRLFDPKETEGGVISRECTGNLDVPIRLPAPSTLSSRRLHPRCIFPIVPPVARCRFLNYSSRTNTRNSTRNQQRTEDGADGAGLNRVSVILPK